MRKRALRSVGALFAACVERYLSSQDIARSMGQTLCQPLWEGIKLYYDPRNAARSRFFHDFPSFRGQMLRNNLGLFSGFDNNLFHPTHIL